MKYFQKAFFIGCLLLAVLSMNSQMTIQVTSTPQLTPLFDDIYITGSFNDWNSADENYKMSQSGNVWTVTLNGTDGAEVLFKFTRGDWDKVEGNAAGAYIENRAAAFQNGQTLQLTIEGWEDIAGNHTVTPHVRIMDSDFFMPQLDRHRRIWITFPPAYFTSDAHYPVVYMHDGQNVFDSATSFAGEWRVDEAMALPSMSGCKQAIFVAIDNGGTLRIDELSPWHNTQYDAGGEGDEYVDFIVQTLKPFVDAHFRTLPSRENTTITGSSLGGLISMYAIAKYNNVFSKAGIFSPAFWFNPEIFDYVESHPLSADSKIYFVCGTNESGSMVPQMQQMRDIVLSTEVPQSNVGYLAVQGGQHNENFWANQFPAVHHFLAACETTAITEHIEDSITFFPNPMKDTVQVAFQSGEIKKITFYDGVGKEVLTHFIYKSNSIDVSKLPTGTYNVRVDFMTYQGKESFAVKTLVKQ